MSCRTSNLVKIIAQPSATRYMSFKVIRSNIEITVTPRRIARLRSNLVHSFITTHTGDTLQMFKVKGQRSRSQRSAGARKIVLGGQALAWGANPAPSVPIPPLPSLFPPLPLPTFPPLPSPLVPSPPLRSRPLKCS